MSKGYDRIWLQYEGDGTWCNHPCEEQENVEYVRKDIHDAEVERLRAALAESEREHRAMRDAAALAGNPAAEAWHIARIRAISAVLSPRTAPACPNCGSASTRYTRADSGECTVCGCIFVWSVLSQKTESGEGSVKT